MICVAPRQGDIQGDTAAAQTFMIAYDTVTEQMSADARTLSDEAFLVYTEPITAQQVNMDHLRYADDLATLSIVSGPPSAIRKIHEWEQCWTRCCYPVELQHSSGTIQLTAQFTGRDAKTSLATFREEMIQAQVHGSITSVVKYLGSLVHNRGSNAAEVDERLRKAGIAWRTLGRVWYVQGVTLRVCLLLFRSVVLGRVLSGLESLVLTQ
eukprot:13381683-Heterocapsa_arctica.AAC.2